MTLQEQLTDEQACIAHHQKAINAAVGRRDKVRAEMEAEKPKLRHGDYGIYANTGNGWIVLERNGALEWFGQSMGAGRPISTMPKGNIVILGNIFDDLAAWQEDVEGFEMPDLHVFWKDGYLKMRGGGKDYVLVDGCSVPKFIRKLRQMAATQNRKQQHDT